MLSTNLTPGKTYWAILSDPDLKVFLTFIPSEGLVLSNLFLLYIILLVIHFIQFTFMNLSICNILWAGFSQMFISAVQYSLAKKHQACKVQKEIESWCGQHHNPVTNTAMKHTFYACFI